jgi:hypothetical protein
MLVRLLAFNLEARLPLEHEPTAFFDEHAEVDIRQWGLGPVRVGRTVKIEA